jgi:hypothetical protein
LTNYETESAIAAIAQRSNKKSGTSQKKIIASIEKAVSGIKLGRVDYKGITVLADQSTGVEGSWTSLSLPSENAIVMFKMVGTGVSDDGTISIQDSNNEPFELFRVESDNVTNSVVLEIADGLQYLTTVAGGNPDWSITYLGSRG